MIPFPIFIHHSHNQEPTNPDFVIAFLSALFVIGILMIVVSFLKEAISAYIHNKKRKIRGHYLLTLEDVIMYTRESALYFFGTALTAAIIFVGILILFTTLFM